MTKRVSGTKGLQVITEVAVVKQDDSKNCVGLFQFIPSTPNPLRWSKDFRYIYIGINPTSCLNIFYPPHMSCNKIVIRIDRQAIPATQREYGVREGKGSEPY
jgi:hypothetical protein